MKKQSQLFKKFQRAYREYWSIIVITTGFSLPTRRKLESTIARLDQLSESELSFLFPNIKAELSKLRLLYGVKVPLETLEPIAKRNGVFSHPKLAKFKDPIPREFTKLLFLRKSLLSQMFENYHLALPIFPYLPPHALISIDVLGVNNSKTIEVYMLEASLFEDMATLWNATSEYYSETSNSETFDKKKFKRLLALNRATAKAAFNFLEGYINGLAYDVLLTQETSNKEKEILSEWDNETQRQKPQSLRQKLLRYPRIACQLDYDPIDENRYDEMSRILKFEQQVRHSLIHPSPRSSRTEDDIERELEFRSLSIETVGKLCDDVIELVFTINKILQGKFGDVEHWLYRRGDQGKFDENIFF